MSISISTMGKFCPPPGSSTSSSSVGGGGGLGASFIQPRKPQVQISRVKYHNNSIKSVSVTNVQEK
jgi:hypothetical protein